MVNGKCSAARSLKVTIAHGSGDVWMTLITNFDLGSGVSESEEDNAVSESIADTLTAFVRNWHV